MSNPRKKSAKDIAFEKERVKCRQEIRKLERELSKYDEMVRGLNEVIDGCQEAIREKDDHIERLLEFTNLSSEEQQLLLNKAKIDSQIDSLRSIIPMAFSHFYDAI